MALRRELGSDHPLTRTVSVYRALRAGATTTAALLLAAVVVALAGKPVASVLVASGSALAAFAAAAAIAAALTRESTVAALARGERSSAPYVRVAALRLTSAPHRRALANGLALALWEAQHLEDIPLARRPPPPTNQLCRVADELAAIIGALRTEAPISVEAVALCDLLVLGGYSSLLYAGDSPELRSHLGRIRFRLANAT